ncbi:MAG: helix-turn-helix domain-containing protein [Myxococcales bacterium]|nr:helix-turn-helix domain-containing protein [Myxococcales bacterium]
MRRFLSWRDIAEELGVSRRTAFRIMHEAGAVNLHGLRLERANLEAWISEQKE